VAIDLIERFFPDMNIVDFPFAPVPEQARWRAPLQRSFLGLGADSAMMGTRRGWLTRHTTFTPHARVQSVRVTQGPWQRRLGLASMHADIVPGPIHVVGAHRDAESAREFALAEAERARLAHLSDTSVRWGVQVTTAESATPDVLEQAQDPSQAAPATVHEEPAPQQVHESAQPIPPNRFEL